MTVLLNRGKVMVQYDAILVTFGCTTSDTALAGYSISGYILQDKKRRFPDGTTITTSAVKTIINDGTGMYALTRNSTYKVVII